MKQTNLFTLIAIVLLISLVACDGANRMTPTPFPATWTPGPALAAPDSFAVDITELLASPETYEDVYVQVTGQYQKRPLLVCESALATNASPATWEIVEETGLRLGAGEFDGAFRSLVPDGLMVTVAGYWQLWEGPVGCGKEANQQALWFLEVTDIISPSPIVQVTLTPSSIDGAPVFSEEAVTPSIDSLQPPPTEGNEDPFAAPTETTETAVFPTNPVINPTEDFSDPEIDPIATATLSSSGYPIGTPIPTSTSSNSSNLTATPQTTTTAVSGNSTPTAPTSSGTPASGNGTTITIDTISEEELGFEFLLNNQTHLWDLILADSTVITVSLAAEPQLNLGLEILDQNGTIIGSSKQAPANEIERVNSLNVDASRPYKIRVSGDGSGKEGSYVILVWGNLEDSVVQDARGMIANGQTKNDTIPADGPRHFWFFYGEEDDVVSITTTANDDHVMLISLYDPEGTVVETDTEEVLYLEQVAEDITLPQTGLYTLWVEELLYESANYTIKLTQQ